MKKPTWETYYLDKIVHGECVQVMSNFPDNSIDLTVTSPPYDLLRDYKGYDFDFESIAAQLFRVTKKGGVVVWVVGDQIVNGSESGTSFKQALYFKEIGFNLHDTMIFEKPAPFPEKIRYRQNFEFMFVFSKGRPKAVNLIKDRKNKYTERWGGGQSERRKDGSIKQRGKQQTYQEFGIRFNIWRIPAGWGYSTKDKKAHNHPAIFPEKLARDHIISWSNPGDIVLDPMCGSGTTCKMAKELGRSWIGIDIAEEYCELARKRLAGTKVPLFTL